jgi:hypothetical protein
MWYSLQEYHVLELVQKTLKKLGLWNAMSKVENTQALKLMTDTKRPFLHCSTCFPHPEQHDTNMRLGLTIAHQQFVTFSLSVTKFFLLLTLRQAKSSKMQ